MNNEIIKVVKDEVVALVNSLNEKVIRFTQKIYVKGEQNFDGKCWEYVISLAVSELVNEDDYGPCLTVSLNASGDSYQLELSVIRSCGKLIDERSISFQKNSMSDIDLKKVFDEMGEVLLVALEQLYLK